MEECQHLPGNTPEESPTAERVKKLQAKIRSMKARNDAGGEAPAARQRATWATLDPDLVRDEKAMRALDADEAKTWRIFWAEVRALLASGD